MEIDRCFEVLYVSKATGHLFDFLNLAVDAFTHRIGDTMMKVGHDVGNMILDRLRRFSKGR